ncbi:MAG: DUF6438 domain-containing protein [Balneolaceae bacterium]|nr:DUF6438 domain-containing protein [Balneolaceae bacterium]
MKKLPILILLIIFTAAGTFYNPVIPQGLSEFSTADTLVQMERTVCFGTCPAYTLSILKDGKVTFNGREFVDHKGIATGQMSQKNLDVLIQRIRESHFMDVPSSPECESRYTDHSSVFLTVKLEDERNSVSHYLGCKGFQYEGELYELEEAIDSLAGVDKWVEGKD